MEATTALARRKARTAASLASSKAAGLTERRPPEPEPEPEPQPSVPERARHDNPLAVLAQNRELAAQIEAVTVEARLYRDFAIHWARDRGHSQGRIAAAAGISNARVEQVLKQKRPTLIREAA